MLASHRDKLIFNFLGFQVGWFVCVLTGSLSALLYTIIFVAIHFHFMGNKQDGSLILLLLLIGFTSDTLLQITGLISFRGSVAINFLYFQPFSIDSFFIQPLWLACLWLLFGLTINHSLAWLFQYPKWCLVVSALIGPFSYYAGSALGAAVITSPLLLFFIVDGIIWVAVFYGLLVYKKKHTSNHTIVRTPHV